MVSCIFQAAIIFLHNAKGENSFFKEHGQQNLMRCAKVYQHDPFLHNTRAIKVLENLVQNFDVFVGENTIPVKNTTVEPPLTSNLHGSVKMNDLPGQYKTSNMDYVLDTNSYNMTSPSPKTDNSSGTFSEPTIPNRFYKTLKAFESTRPEDMFTTSLSLTLGKTMEQPSYEVEEEFHQCNNLPFDFNPPVIEQPVVVDQCHPIDLASLSSQIPLWDIPSGISWNDWESFMKTNANL
jgi:hypothetical protein